MSLKQQDIIPRKESLINSRFYDLLTRLLEWDANKRITVKEALRHPYFAINPSVSFISGSPDFHEFARGMALTVFIPCVHRTKARRSISTRMQRSCLERHSSLQRVVKAQQNKHCSIQGAT